MNKNCIEEFTLAFKHLYFALIALPSGLLKVYNIIIKGIQLKPNTALFVIVLFIFCNNMYFITRYRIETTQSSREVALRDTLERYKLSCDAQLEELDSLKAVRAIEYKSKIKHHHKIINHFKTIKDSI